MDLHGFMSDKKIKSLQPGYTHFKRGKRLLVGGAVLLACMLLLSTGCVRHAHLGAIAINPEEIASGIVKEEGKSAVLEAEVAVSPEAKRQKSYMVEAPGEGKNKALSQLPEKITRKETGLAATEEDEKDGIQLNFDNADIYEVIQVIAQTLELNYIIDPQVKGVVNIQSGQKVPLSQLFPVFQKILHINGLDIRSEGFYDYIYVAKKSSAEAIYSPDQIGQLKDSSARVIQIIPVVHLPAQEALKLIEPYLSDQGTIYELPVQNMLIINDYESKVIDGLMVLAKLDIAPMASLKVRLVRVDNAPLFDVRDELLEVLNALKVNTKNFDGVSVMALERVNSLLLVSNDETLVNTAWKWIEDLDSVPSLDRDNIYIYNVRNSIASELAELISSLIAEEDPKSKTAQKKATTGKDDPRKAQQVAKKKTSDGTHKSLSTLRFAGEPVLFADDDRNIILIRALPPDYSRMVKLLERLDNMPRQVLVEVIVAEVTLTNKLNLGVEWALHNNDLKINDSQYTQGFSTYGQLIGDSASSFTYSVFKSATDIKGLLKTLASETELTILSSPQVLVLNNETATVNVGNQVPIETSTTQTGTVVEEGGTAAVIDRTIQYKDTGVILEVTPQINYNGIILLDIKQTVSSAIDTEAGVTSTATIKTAELKTKLAVKDGQSIMIGGMISKNDVYGETGIPLLKDIPLFGYLFKTENRSEDRTELLVMVTPYVIETEDVLDQYIKEFGRKMDELRGNLHAPAKAVRL